MIRGVSLLGIITIFTACVGIDEVDDPIVGESIAVKGPQFALLVGDTLSLCVDYRDRYGISRDIQPVWLSSDPNIASVSPFGLVSAIASGQSEISASVGATGSLPVLVSVVGSTTEVALIAITSPVGQQLAVGQQITLMIQVTDLEGNIFEDFDVLWTSSQPQVLGIDPEGNITGLSNGVSKIRAIVNGLMSNELTIIVGPTSRSGTFQGANGYDASGTATLFLNTEGQLMLTLSSNFSTDFALGTFIYLSNSTSGGATAAGGVEVQGITSGGGHSFNISSVNPNIGISDYLYVIVLCKPASITFGFAQLN